ncbi:MAG: rod shape-determining protein MreD [Nitrospiraceae bacterium]
MRVLLYGALILTVAPAQATLLHTISLGGTQPDLGLVTACLVGLLRGELEGVLLGFALGFTQDVLSAGAWGLHAVTKSGVGLVAGLAGRQVAHLTPVVVIIGIFTLSCLSSAAILLTSTSGGDWWDVWTGVQSVLIPQAIFDTCIGGGLYWLVANRFSIGRTFADERF